MNEVLNARREGGRCCFLMHEPINSDQLRSSFIVEQIPPCSEQFEVLDKKKGMSPRFSKKPPAPCFDTSTLPRFSLAPIPHCPPISTEEGLDQPQRLLKAERDKGLAPDRQVPFQAGQPIGKRDAACQVVRTKGAEQEHRDVCGCPASAGILQHIERRRVRPLRIINEENDRRTSRQSVPKARYRL